MRLNIWCRLCGRKITREVKHIPNEIKCPHCKGKYTL